MSQHEFDYDFARGRFFKNDDGQRAVLIPTSGDKVDDQSVLLFAETACASFHQLLISGSSERADIKRTRPRRILLFATDIVAIKDPATMPDPSSELLLEASHDLGRYCGYVSYNLSLEDGTLALSANVLEECPPFSISDEMTKKFGKQQLEWLELWGVRLERLLDEALKG